MSDDRCSKCGQMVRKPLPPRRRRALTTVAFRRGRWRRDAVLEALDQVRLVLAGLSDEVLEDLVARGLAGGAEVDGFGCAAGAERVSGPEVGGSRPVESATLVLLDGKSPSDPAGVAIRDLFGLLASMCDMAVDVDRLAGFLASVADGARGRVSSLSGPCVVCTREVSGSSSDRLRAGLCEACRVAWRRATDVEPGLDRGRWMAARQARLAELGGDLPVEEVVYGGDGSMLAVDVARLRPSSPRPTTPAGKAKGRWFSAADLRLGVTGTEAGR